MNRTQVIWCGILLVLCCAAGGIFFWKRGSSPSPAAKIAPIVTRSPEELEAAWKTEVQTILQRHEQSQDHAEARGALLRVTVPGPRRDLHLALVLALEGLTHQHPDAATRWQQAMTAVRAAF